VVIKPVMTGTETAPRELTVHCPHAPS